MINSMTGYGQAQGDVNGLDCVVEIKTVNNRFFKAVIKLPELVAFMEQDIERLLRQNLARGTVNYSLRFKNTSAEAMFELDGAALEAVVQSLGRIDVPPDIARSVDLANLLNLPGVVRPASPDEQTAEVMRTGILEISRQALDRLKQMRAAEGAALEADLETQCARIHRDLETIRSRIPVVLQEYAAKLRKRVDELMAHAQLELEAEALAREVAIYADRSDVSEEIARLESHLEQFTQTSTAGGQAGRRLDFISQEMLREANTIASKASDAQIARCVVDIKCHIDRIKEQVQNVE